MRTKRVTMRIERLAHGAGLDLPAYQTTGAAGLDLVAALPGNKPVELKPGGRTLVPTGLVIEIPDGCEAQVRPRSGLALKHGLTVLNSPGTIDSDYRGEVMVILVNLGDAPFTIRRGERIAQLVVQAVVRAELEVVVRTSATQRGKGGFGSTGGGADVEREGGGRKPKKNALPARGPRAKSVSRKPGRRPAVRSR